jgi:Protein of unknown function (DUF2842)
VQAPALATDPMSPRTMPIRLRKFIGAIGLFALVVVWALFAMALAQVPAIRNNAVAAALYYAIAGIGWVLPAVPLVRWMSTPAIRRQESKSEPACKPDP